MGLLSNQISRDELKPGDHIYSWRKVYTYSHHGIYVGDEKVIHYTSEGSVGSGSGSILDRFGSSVPKQNNSCPKCGHQSKKLHGGVISSCLDCFLAGGNLYLFEYSVSPAFFLSKRGGTCTTATSDPCDEVIYRAKFLLSRNVFGAYHLLENNCEDFATYCKTGLVVESKIKHGSSSGQASSSSGQANAVFEFAALLYAVVNQSRKVFRDRLCSDIGKRSDVIKVPVEELVEILRGRSEDNKKST